MRVCCRHCQSCLLVGQLVRQLSSTLKMRTEARARQGVPAAGACWASNCQDTAVHLATACVVPAGQRAEASRLDAHIHSNAEKPLADVAGQQQHLSQGGDQQQHQSEQVHQQQPASDADADAKTADRPAEDEVLFQMDEVRILGIHVVKANTPDGLLMPLDLPGSPKTSPAQG